MAGASEQRSVNITYETLFELVRLEKNKEELQKLDPTFYQDVITYLKEKYDLLQEVKGSLGLFSDSDKDNTEKQVINIKRLLRDLYDRREKKMITMALNKTRANAQIVDVQNHLPEERRFFDAIVVLLQKGRRDMLQNLIELKMPAGFVEIIHEEPQKVKASGGFVPAAEFTPKEKTQVKFIHSVSKFVGPELEEYGPFESEDVALLPTEIVNILVFKRKAVVIDDVK